MSITPELIAKITLYPTDQGGRRSPIIGGWRGADSWFGCPCKFDPKDFSSWDCRILNGLESLAPGESKQFGMIFLTPEIVPVLRLVPKFYLWESGIIGEATAHL
jgi:hypothetical protein